MKEFFKRETVAAFVNQKMLWLVHASTLWEHCINTSLPCGHSSDLIGLVSPKVAFTVCLLVFKMECFCSTNLLSLATITMARNKKKWQEQL